MTIKELKREARKDNFGNMVPSDVRCLVADWEAMHEGIVELIAYGLPAHIDAGLKEILDNLKLKP
jgi:hypothetical protein